MEQCPICKMSDEKIKITNDSSGKDLLNIECLYCMPYKVSGSLYPSLIGNTFPHTTSCWIVEQHYKQGVTPVFMSEDLDKLLHIPDLRMSQKYERFIEFVCKTNGKLYEPTSKILMNLCWCQDHHELRSLFRKAEANNHLHVVRDKQGHTLSYTSTYDAREFIENLGYKTNSNKIFMAFHFTRDMKEEFEDTVKRAVTDASNGKLEAVRVSSSTTEHNTKIDDELISMLKASKAVIADFTGQRNAVYYEAGYAMGMGIPVIWTCRKSDVDSLSFDTRQYPHIIWENEKDLYKQVSNRIKAKIL